jgi:hypothetical protein
MTQPTYHSRRNTFEVHVSRLRMLGMVFLAALMTAGSAWATQSSSIKAFVAGWVGLFLFGAAFLFTVWQIGRMEPVLVIDAAGIDYRTLGIGVVPWDEVADVGIGEIRGQKFLCITLLDETPYAARISWYRRQLARANAAMGFPLLTITMKGMNRTLDDVLQAIATYRSAT